MQYYYEAIDATGKEFSGTIESNNEEGANFLIRKKGLFVTKLTNNHPIVEKQNIVFNKHKLQLYCMFVTGVLVGQLLAQLMNFRG